MLILTIEVLAIVIPLAGIVALLVQKQQSDSSIRLLLTSLGCLVMNIGTLLMETAQTEAEASMAVRFEYLGNAIFYYFFITFLIAYLRIKIPKLPLYCWACFECAVVVRVAQKTLAFGYVLIILFIIIIYAWTKVSVEAVSAGTNSVSTKLPKVTL